MTARRQDFSAQFLRLAGKRGAAENAGRAARRHSPIPVRPPNAGCDSGPLIVGAGEGDASGAGIRLPIGACGLGGAKRVVARA
jgi:hypothetical protein